MLNDSNNISKLYYYHYAVIFVNPVAVIIYVNPITALFVTLINGSDSYFIFRTPEVKYPGRDQARAAPVVSLFVVGGIPKKLTDLT